MEVVKISIEGVSLGELILIVLTIHYCRVLFYYRIYG